MSESRLPVAGHSRLFLYLGAAALAAGVAAAILGIVLVSGDGSDSGSQPPPVARAGSTSLPTTTILGPSVGSATTSTDSAGAQPATTRSPAPPVPPEPGPSPTSTAPAGTATTGGGAEPTPPGVLPPTGDPAGRLAQAAGRADYAVLVLEREGWQLSAVDLGVFEQQTYVDSVYRRGGDYLNLSQAPRGDQPALPNAEEMTVRGVTGELLDMGGGILLAQWEEGGSRVRVTSDLARDELLGLLAGLTEAGADR